METQSHTKQNESRLYEKLIYLYPPSYRKRHCQELLQNFEDLERDIGSRRFLWAFVVSDFIKSLGQQYMEYIKHNRWAQFALAAVIILMIFMGQQRLMLQKAHSTFDNYAAFRGCEQITSQNATSGTCTIAGGQTIKIVEFNGKWYLDGDLPPLCFGNFCL